MAYDPLVTPIDFVILRGQQTPGIATIERAVREIKVDEIGGYGVSGSVSVVHGKKLVKFDIVIVLLTPEDWADWEEFKTIVLTMPVGSNAKALDVWHPWLSTLDVTGCVVDAVSQPVPDDTGGFTIRISCTEFRRPQLTLATPVAADNKAPEQDPAQIYIGQLLGQLQELAK